MPGFNAPAGTTCGRLISRTAGYCQQPADHELWSDDDGPDSTFFCCDDHLEETLAEGGLKWPGW